MTSGQPADWHPVFTGSSNLAEGGEENNGNNLIAIYDPVIAVKYAVQATLIIDHFRFRAAMSTATGTPLLLRKDAWWRPYYNEHDLHCVERTTFCAAPAEDLVPRVI